MAAMLSFMLKRIKTQTSSKPQASSIAQSIAFLRARQAAAMTAITMELRQQLEHLHDTSLTI
jgi:predicted component of type VI protein secretion system